MAFVDDLTWASDDDLITATGNPGWTLAHDGSATVEVETVSFSSPGYRSRANGGGSGDTIYVCTDQSSDDHETIGRIKNFIANNAYALCARIVDYQNYWGMYLGGTGSAGLRLVQNSSGTRTDIITTQGADEQWVKVEASGSDIKFYLGGTGASASWTQEGSTQTDSNTSTRQGISAWDLDSDAPWGYFEAGALGGGTGPTASPWGHQRLDNQYSAIAASRLNGVLQ